MQDALSEAKSGVTQSTPLAKPGLKTTEFWVTLGVVIAHLFGLFRTSDASLQATSLAGLYVVARLILKWLALKHPEAFQIAGTIEQTAVRFAAPAAEMTLSQMGETTGPRAEQPHPNNAQGPAPEQKQTAEGMGSTD